MNPMKEKEITDYLLSSLLMGNDLGIKNVEIKTLDDKGDYDTFSLRVYCDNTNFPIHLMYDDLSNRFVDILTLTDSNSKLREVRNFLCNTLGVCQGLGKMSNDYNVPYIHVTEKSLHGLNADPVIKVHRVKDKHSKFLAYSTEDVSLLKKIVNLQKDEDLTERLAEIAFINYPYMGNNYNQIAIIELHEGKDTIIFDYSKADMRCYKFQPQK